MTPLVSVPVAGAPRLRRRIRRTRAGNPRGRGYAPRVLPERVSDKLDALPASPGVYLFEGSSGEVLYVGKASSLRSRVRSYFLPGSTDVRAFVPFLAGLIEDLTTFVVANEKEAALLENELIKEKQPRFNVKLRDDKDFLSLRIDSSEAWPKLGVVRRPKPDGARYFGPYDSATSARQTLRQINRFFQLRTCKDGEFRSRVRPCLQYQIKRCPAPCVKEVDREEYGAQVELVALFLEGRHETLVEDLERRMRDAATDLAFERAATYRDQLRAVERARTKQRIATVTDLDQDVLGLHRAGDQAEVAVLEVRGGHLTRVRTYALADVTLPDDELLAGFAGEYYQRGAAVPDELLLPQAIEAAAGLEGWLSQARDKKMSVLVPKRGAKVRLLEMAAENATHAFREKARAREDIEARLEELQRRLRLEVSPRRIECIDISHIGGSDTVAAITALRDGELDKTRYRTFRMKRAGGGDDYGAMYEALTRRFERGKNDEEGWELPDLFVVDGGKGQLGVAVTVMEDLDVQGVDVVGLAKARVVAGEQDGEGATLRTSERVFVPGLREPFVLKPHTDEFFLLTHLRDEAHRFAITYHRKLRKKKRLTSDLDSISGVGPARRRTLLRAFGSMKRLRAATADEIAQVEGIGPQLAASIQHALQGGTLQGGTPQGGE